MSSGIRDAANIAWKLALVVRGQAGEAVLGSYERERRPHVEKMTRLALAISRVLPTQDRRAARARDTAFRLFTRLPGSGYVTSGGFKPSARLPAGGLVASSSRRRAAGSLFVQPRVALNGESLLLDDVLGHGFAVLAMDRDPRWLTEAAPELWEGLETRFVRVTAAGREPEGPPADVVVDVDGRLAAWFGRRRADTVVLRPDRFVFGAYRRGDDPTAVAREVERVLARAPGAAADASPPSSG
jgi:3-(3-hydroxy-phenyl)propionate hydroxylase